MKIFINLFFCFLAPTLVLGQNVLRPEKVVIFNDAAYVSLKGVLRFHNNVAEVSTGYDFIPGTVKINLAPELSLVYIKFRRDTITKTKPVKSWRDVLLANAHRKVSIVYQIGNEYDELAGEVKIIDPQSGLFILKTGPNAEFFIPFNQIRQVMVDSAGITQVRKKVEDDLIELKLTQDVQFAPVQITGLLKGLTWEPECFIRLDDEKTASYQLKAELFNESGEFEGVEIQLSGENIIGNETAAEKESGRISLGQMALGHGDRMLINLSTSQHEYEAQYQSTIPWTGIGSETMSGPVPVKYALGFTTPVLIAQTCNVLSLTGQGGKNLGEIKPGNTPPEGITTLPLSDESAIDVRFQETVKKKGGKPEDKAGLNYIRSEIEGKCVMVNQKSENVIVRVVREIDGEVKERGGGTVEKVKGTLRQQIIWRFAMKPGQKREIPYIYDALIPEK